MRVFITGASGFIGRALCERYAADGHEVLGAVIWSVTRRDRSWPACRPAGPVAGLGGGQRARDPHRGDGLTAPRAPRRHVAFERARNRECDRGRTARGRAPVRALLLGHGVRARVPRPCRRALPRAQHVHPVPGFEDRVRAGDPAGPPRGPRAVHGRAPRRRLRSALAGVGHRARRADPRAAVRAAWPRSRDPFARVHRQPRRRGRARGSLPGRGGPGVHAV